MRRLLVFTPLAALLVGIGTAVFAASERHVTAEFTPFAASGISGKVDLTENAEGETNVTLQVRGLQPGTEYISQFYGNNSCQLEPNSAQNVVGTFRANPAGIAVVTTKLNKELSEIESISVRLESDMSLQACADIPQ